MMQKYYFCGLEKPILEKNHEQMMKKVFILLIFNILYYEILFSQISDDFSSSYFGAQTIWQGDTIDFVMNSNGQLQLNASQAGISTLSVNIENMDVWNQDIEWDFQIRLAFSPSANNFARFYLLADTLDLKKENLSGFYLQFGENLSQDAIELFYTDGSQAISVMRGPNAMIANSFELKVKVTKSANDLWQLWVDERNIGWYQQLAEAEFSRPFQAKAAGIYCKYTIGNINKFFFDNIYIGPQQIDSIPPTVNFCYGHDDLRMVSIGFSKMMDENSLATSHYRLEEDGRMPLACEYVFPNYNQIMLFFSEDFEEDMTYHLSISGVQDHSNNVIQDTIVPFHCHKIKRNDVLIHEIMADPSPVIDLPAAEYIELYNRTDGELILENWKLQLGKTRKTLPDMLLPGHGFAVIAATEDAPLLQAFCDTVYALSSLSITDGGQELILYNSYEEVVHLVTFSSSWHRQTIKRDGGWSLEMIDPGNPCAGEENWNSSCDANGGTPGQANSIAAENPDLEPPAIITTTVMDSNCLRVRFSETVLMNPLQVNFSLDHDINITAVVPVPPYQNAVDLHFDKNLQQGIIYQLTLNAGICDCVGLTAWEGQSISFGLDVQPYYKYLIINEILFNPPNSEDADYVEIYNRSNQIIDLKNVKIGSGGDAMPDKAAIAVSEGYQLFPGQMVALCKNRKLTEQHYQPLYPQNLLQCDSLPAFANAQGVVHLTDLSLRTLDRLSYSDDMHYSMLSSTDGVALERVHYDEETQNNNNWKSAAANVNFGTPGYVNSQYAESLSTEDVLRIEPDIFSPDNDGVEDFTEIYCRFSELENRVTVAVYDRQGMLVKKLANNELCGSEARYLWDGGDENGRKMPPALYVVRLSYWNLTGKKRGKQAVVGLR